jgi:hypothetical protein
MAKTGIAGVDTFATLQQMSALLLEPRICRWWQASQQHLEGIPGGKH